MSNADPQPPAPAASSSPDRKPLPKGRIGRKNKRDRFTPSRPGNVQIQDDDRLILELADQHRIITSRQLLAVAGSDRNERAFLHRLQRLSDDEYLTRPRHQERVGKPMAYALGINGHRELHPDLWRGPQAPADWRQKDRRIGLKSIDHEATLTEVLLAFRLAAETRDWPFRWSFGDAFRDETGFRRSVEVRPAGDAPFHLPLNPDAFVTVEAPDGQRFRWFLEIDMGTEPHVRQDLRRSSIRQKLLAYWHLDHTRLHGYERNVDSFRVLFVTSTEVRLETMRLAARDVDPKGLGAHYFHFSTHDRCTLADPDAVIDGLSWWSAKTGYDNPRRLLLDTCPDCNQLVDIGNEAYRILNSNPPGLAFAAGSTPLPDHLPDDEEPAYAHHVCPGHASSQRT